MAKKNGTKKTTSKQIVTLTHDEASRKNIPTAELQSVMKTEQQSPLRVAYERRNRDLDPQLVWRGKDEQDWSDLVVPAPPLFIQEKVHPKVLIDDLRREAEAARIAQKLASDKAAGIGPQIDLFADFNGLPATDARTDFYAHDAHWSNRMILGDSLQVMASLAEREGLRGKVQCIYIDPPYGIKFNSNFQWSTTSRDVKDSLDNMTREPEQVKAFRDTWRDGVNSYLTYLRDRLTVARDLLHDSGSVFVQIGDENVHRLRALLDEIFGPSNFVSQLVVKKLAGVESTLVPSTSDYVLWYAKQIESTKYRQPFQKKGDASAATERYDQIMTEGGESRALSADEKSGSAELPNGARVFQADNLVGAEFRPDTTVEVSFWGQRFHPGAKSHWKTSCAKFNGDDSTMPPNDHRSRRSRPRPHLRFWDDSVRGRAMGPAVDHD